MRTKKERRLVVADDKYFTVQTSASRIGRYKSVIRTKVPTTGLHGPLLAGRGLRDKNGSTSTAFSSQGAIGNTIGALVSTAGRGKAAIETIS
jgi:hypothetical protein